MVLYHPCKPFQIDYRGDLWYPISKEETAVKVLSARLAMKDGCSPKQFRHTITEWLKAGSPSKEVGERYETEEISAKPITLKAGYCTLESFIYSSDRMRHMRLADQLIFTESRHGAPR